MNALVKTAATVKKKKGDRIKPAFVESLRIRTPILVIM
jgi:hypothetical protein